MTKENQWTDTIVLEKGMRVKDLPQDWRCSFSPPIQGGQPEFTFKNGQFYTLDYMEWEVIESPIPWGTTVVLDRRTWRYSYEKPSLSFSSQKKLSEIAMVPKKHGLVGRLAQHRAKNIVWC